MIIILSDVAHRSFENLFNRKVYLTDKNFCESFVYYCKRIANDFTILGKGGNRYTLRRGYRVSTLSALQVVYKVSTNYIIIYSIGFVGLMHLYRLCTQERKTKSKPLSKHPSNFVASKSPSDYQYIPKGYGGEINGTQVKIVQRKGIITSSGKPLFNYYYNEKILSKVDFLSCNPFKFIEGQYKATAYGANGKKYWIMPSGRRLLYCSTLINTELLIENKVRQIIKETMGYVKKQANTETYDKIGEWNVVYEQGTAYSLFPFTYKGVENFGELHRDIMYANPKGNTYCVFRIPQTKKYLFTILHSNSNFEPIKKDKIPEMLINHFQYKHGKD